MSLKSFPSQHFLFSLSGLFLLLVASASITRGGVFFDRPPTILQAPSDTGALYKTAMSSRLAVSSRQTDFGFVVQAHDIETRALLASIRSAKPTEPFLPVPHPSTVSDPATDPAFGEFLAASGSIFAVGGSHVYLFDTARPNPSVPMQMIQMALPDQTSVEPCALALSESWLCVGTSRTIRVYRKSDVEFSAAFSIPANIDFQKEQPLLISGDVLVVREANEFRFFRLSDPEPATAFLSIPQSAAVSRAAFDGKYFAAARLGSPTRVEVYDITGYTPAVSSFSILDPSGGSVFRISPITGIGPATESAFAYSFALANSQLFVGTGSSVVRYDLSSQYPSFPAHVLTNPKPAQNTLNVSPSTETVVATPSHVWVALPGEGSLGTIFRFSENPVEMESSAYQLQLTDEDSKWGRFGRFVQTDGRYVAASISRGSTMGVAVFEPSRSLEPITKIFPLAGSDGFYFAAWKLFVQSPGWHTPSSFDLRQGGFNPIQNNRNSSSLPVLLADRYPIVVSGSSLLKRLPYTSTDVGLYDLSNPLEAQHVFRDVFKTRQLFLSPPLEVFALSPRFAAFLNDEHVRVFALGASPQELDLPNVSAVEARSIALSGNRLVISSKSGLEVQVFDLDQGPSGSPLVLNKKLDDIAYGPTMAFDGNFIAVCGRNASGQFVEVIDLGESLQIRSQERKSFPLGSASLSVALRYDLLAVSTPSSNQVQLFGPQLSGTTRIPPNKVYFETTTSSISEHGTVRIRIKCDRVPTSVFASYSIQPRSSSSSSVISVWDDQSWYSLGSIGIAVSGAPEVVSRIVVPQRVSFSSYTEETIEVSIAPSTQRGGDGKATLTLHSPYGDMDLGFPHTHEIFIDNESRYGFETNVTWVSEDQGNAFVTVRRYGLLHRSQALFYRAIPRSRFQLRRPFAEADNQIDFELPSDILFFPAGVDRASIPIKILSDRTVESTEMFGITLVNAASAGSTTHDVVIHDAPASPGPGNPGTVGFETAAETVPETTIQNPHFIPIRRYGSLDEAASVSYRMSGTATPRVDYYALEQGTLHFAPGQDVVHLEIAIAPDYKAEPDETVLVTLDSPSSTIFLGRLKEHTLYISSGDSLPDNGYGQPWPRGTFTGFIAVDYTNAVLQISTDNHVMTGALRIGARTFRFRTRDGGYEFMHNGRTFYLYLYRNSSEVFVATLTAPGHPRIEANAIRTAISRPDKAIFAEFAGTYTAAVKYPSLFCPAFVTLSATGKVRVTGILANGYPFSFGAAGGLDGHFRLALEKRGQTVLADLSFPNTRSVIGMVQHRPDPAIPMEAFALEGRRFQRIQNPKASLEAWVKDEVTLQVDGFGPDQPNERDASISTNGAQLFIDTAYEDISLSINVRTGMVKAVISSEEPSRRTMFTGALMQQQPGIPAVIFGMSPGFYGWRPRGFELSE